MATCPLAVNFSIGPSSSSSLLFKYSDLDTLKQLMITPGIHALPKAFMTEHGHLSLGSQFFHWAFFKLFIIIQVFRSEYSQATDDHARYPCTAKSLHDGTWPPVPWQSIFPLGLLQALHYYSSI